VTASSPVRAATADAIGEAVALLRQGRLVAFPTETVYGLGADAGDDAAVARVFAVKARPRFNPLIVHVADRTGAWRLAEADDRADRMARALWPGPLTLVLPRRPDAGISLLATAGLDTVAVRVPDHEVALALLAQVDRPLAAPSANPSGRVSPTTAGDVAADLGAHVALILDGGPCRVGLESTVVDLTTATPVLLRPGGVGVETIEAVIGPLAAAGPGRPRAPGMLRRHYAPGLPLRLEATSPRPGEAFLGFGAECPGATLSLSERGDVEEAAARLFHALRRLDHPPFTAIAVAPIPEVGLGRAINDRLRRAAVPRADDDAWNDDRGPSAPCLLPDAID
jgi:L-threonylcarbamoyladenylate synthase